MKTYLVFVKTCFITSIIVILIVLGRNETDRLIVPLIKIIYQTCVFKLL